MTYKELAKATQELLQGATAACGKANVRVLAKIHDMLDGLQDGSLVIGMPPKDKEPGTSPEIEK